VSERKHRKHMDFVIAMSGAMEQSPHKLVRLPRCSSSQ